VTRLRGGLTAAMDLITVAGPDDTRRVVLRRWYIEDAAKEGLVEREAVALATVRGTGVPAPELIAADPDGSASGARCTLTTALAGTPDLAPVDIPSWVRQLAEMQARIHAVPATMPTRWDGWYDVEAPLDWIADPGLREAARMAAASPRLDHRAGLAHGDYQHFNVLWRDGQRVVDWPNAATAPRGVDVGHCRLNLAVLFSADLADDYLAAYERAAGLTVDAGAELRSVLNFDQSWPGFIPRQVDGRAPLDIAGMPDRVADLVRPPRRPSRLIPRISDSAPAKEITQGSQESSQQFGRDRWASKRARPWT
jgi:aminoglycoside phosphotransferase (APT) family kinase protein